MHQKAKDLFLLHERKARAAVSSFAGLIDTPHNFASPLTVLANTKLYASIASPPAGAKFEFFSFPFDALDATKWDQFLSNGTFTAVDGQLDIALSAIAGSNAFYSTTNAYDLRDSEVYVRLVRPMTTAVDTDGARSGFRIQDLATNSDYIEWWIESNGFIGARTCDNGAIVNNLDVHTDWASSGYAWLKISLNAAGTTATWWTAPDADGVPGTWTQRHTFSTLPSTFASAKVTLFAEYWRADPGAILQSARFDSLNTGRSILLCSVNGADRYIRSGAAGEIVPLGYFEKGATLTAVYNASTINLYLGAPLGGRPLIATKTV